MHKAKKTQNHVLHLLTELTNELDSLASKATIELYDFEMLRKLEARLLKVTLQQKKVTKGQISQIHRA